MIRGTSGDDHLEAVEGTTEVRGGEGNDTLVAGDVDAKLFGGPGDDVLYAPVKSASGGEVHGGSGNDVIYASPLGKAQVHAYGNDGDDEIHIDLSDENAPFGTHAYGGPGKDTFHFHTNDTTARHTGRLDDFNADEDRITVDGKLVDLDNLDEGERVVEWNDQKWLLINDNILYALEGARPDEHGRNGDEPHFIEWPHEWEQGVPEDADVPYRDPESDKCFVATACYGDEAHPDVQYLREFRDTVLVRSRPGRAFIAFYWWIGPKLARHVQAGTLRGRACKAAIGVMVRALQKCDMLAAIGWSRDRRDHRE